MSAPIECKSARATAFLQMIILPFVVLSTLFHGLIHSAAAQEIPQSTAVGRQPTGWNFDGTEIPAQQDRQILPPAWPVPLASPMPSPLLTETGSQPLLQPVRHFAHPLSTDFAISALPFTSAEAPAIDGSRVVWYDDRSQGPTDVWGYDLSTGQTFQVTFHPDAQFIADISADLVVYEDNRNGSWDIYATRLSTGEEFAVATGPHHQRYPRTWGDYIVYQDETSDYFQSNVYLYQISTDKILPLAVAPSYQGRPDIDNGWVVWTEWRSGKWQLGIYEIATEAYTYRIIDCDDDCRPRIHGHEVVWNGWRNGRYDIYLYNLKTDTENTVYAGPGDQRYPVISDVLIAWQDQDTYGNWDVFVYVRADGTLFPVTLEASLQKHPAVYGNVVVWQDNRSRTWDIYGLVWEGVVPPGSVPALQNPRDLHVGAFADAEIHLSWTDNITNELGFVVQRAEGIFGTQWSDLVTLPANTTSYVDTSGTVGESYWYRVRSYNAAGNSSYSNESYATALDSVPNLDERYMHLLINEARMDPGVWGYPEMAPVNPLDWNANLAFSARAHALGMNNSNCCQGHIDLAGRGPGERAYASGYPYGTGENLFVAMTGRAGMEGAHLGFMNSEGHRNNLMAADYRHTGIGFAPGGRGTLVEVFSGGPTGTTVPSLPGGIAVPYTGTIDTTFDFLVSFWNMDLQPPTSARVFINGTPYDMSLRNGYSGRGTYIYSTSLPLGDHSYYFEFKWGSPQQIDRLPERGEFSGPYVRPHMTDLEIINLSSSRLVAGYTGRIWATIQNSGELAAENVVVRFYLGDPLQGGVQVGAPEIISYLQPGEIQSVDFFWKFDTPGVYTIHVWVDPDNAISEATKNNNMAKRRFIVGESRRTLWYVDGSVPVSGNGRTPNTAFKTITEALRPASPGDTVSVAAGTYVEHCSLPEGVKLLGSGAERTFIQGGEAEGSVVSMSMESTIQGFTIRSSGTSFWDAGIWINDNASPTISHNRITGNSMGIVSYCFEPPCTNRPLIHNNIIDGNTGYGINLSADAGATVINNTIAGNKDGIHSNGQGMQLLNNIIAWNSNVGFSANHKPIQNGYNNLWGNGRNYEAATAGEGDLSVDPLFVDSANGNYRLRADSPLLDAGHPDPQYNDPDGSRNEMGAYGGPWAVANLSRVTVSISPINPQGGETVNVQITLNNAGAPAQDAQIVVDLPEGVTYVAGSGTPNGVVSVQGKQLTASLGAVGTGASVEVKFSIAVEKAANSLVLPMPLSVTWQGGSYASTHTIIVNGKALYLPSVRR
jgi:beta propeller repeat protein/parallel beta-helix repeat protein